jgi:hypothetical protein
MLGSRDIETPIEAAATRWRHREDMMTISQAAFRTPYNDYQQEPGSIHNDAVATRLGFKGGTIPGSVHMDQFVPLLLDLYGPQWWESGDMSMYFTQATVHAEPVRALVEPGPGRAKLTMFNESDALICRGTASARAPDSLSEFSLTMQKQTAAAPGTLRILGNYAPGDESFDIPIRVELAKLDDVLSRITEPHPRYVDEHVLPPSLMVHLTGKVRPHIFQALGTSVGLFGALEIRFYRGVLRAGVTYIARTKLLKFVESPKAEGLWYDVVVQDATTGVDLACVRYLLRFMKASSPLWADQFPHS